MDITVNHLFKTYGQKQIFQNFSHTFKDQSVTAVMGPSGCGKTTLLSMLMGLAAFDGGTITGLENKKIAAVFQEDRLCENLSALYNLKYVLPKDTNISALKEPLLEAGLTEKDIFQPVRELSGGMKRRVAIMRALCAPSDLVIMDEPFQGLDEGTKALMIDLVKNRITNKQVIWVTHSLSEAMALNSEILPLTKS